MGHGVPTRPYKTSDLRAGNAWGRAWPSKHRPDGEWDLAGAKITAKAMGFTIFRRFLPGPGSENVHKLQKLCAASSAFALKLRERPRQRRVLFLQACGLPFPTPLPRHPTRPRSIQCCCETWRCEGCLWWLPNMLEKIYL